MKQETYYTACQSKTTCNEAFRDYFRLYKKEGGRYILIDQGLAAKVDGWLSNGAVFIDNPYPDID